MNKDILIRNVTVELLRLGPAHNQLLSPAMQYIGICDDAEAGVVTQPYEHAAFLRRMKVMRYVDGADNRDRLPVLRDVGIDMARVLGAVPLLPGSLTGDMAGRDTLVHLRLVLSASELALLPFELAKMPSGPTSAGEGWLSLQARVPVVITRRTRNVSAAGVRWPQSPRILFIAADPAQIPFDEHREALMAAVAPFRYPGRDDPVQSLDGRREQFGSLLTILKNARFDEVAAECAANRYTHVHILAHGDVDPSVEDVSYGLVLHDADGEPDVISGERFASAFSRIVGNEIHRPSVVTLASCDGGDVGSVVVPGASIAHALHQAGVALVVASQFPLSKAGSVHVANGLYRGLLWGENPWALLHRIRTELHSRLTAHSHDWASLVVYEALPADLDDQLEEARYRQGRLAMNAALERIDQAVAKDGARLDPIEHSQLQKAVLDTRHRMPMRGRFAMECLGLCGSSLKRLAEASFKLALDAGADAAPTHALSSCGLLEHALADYTQAARGFLVNQGTAVQQVSSLHWLLVQQLSLSAVLGKSVRPGTAETARLSAEAYLDLPDTMERAWAHGSLAELCLLAVANLRTDATGRAAAAAQALVHVGELMKLVPADDDFAIKSTRKQFARYADWWGHPLLEQALEQSGVGQRPSWQDQGVVAAAAALVELLDRRSGATRAAAKAPSRTPEPRFAPTEASPTAAPTPAANPVGVDNATGPDEDIGGMAVPDATVIAEAKAFDQLNAPQLAAQATSISTSPQALPSPGTVVFTIEMLPAGHGDCLWIEYGMGTALSRVLVDCGTARRYPGLHQRISQLPMAERHIELFVLSHIDDDHIGAAIPLLADTALGVRYGDIWFNGWKHLPQDKLNARQGEEFSALIDKHKLPWNQWQNGQAIVLGDGALPTHTLPGGLVLTLLSPTRATLANLAVKWEKEIKALNRTPGDAAQFERLGRSPSTSTEVDRLAESAFTGDTAANNGSSIAVLAEYQGKAVLLGADAYSPVLQASVSKLLEHRGQTRLKLDAFKLPHHGSANNLDVTLLALLECKNYLVSTNGKHFNHPDREAIARVIRHGGTRPRLWFNHRSPINEVWDRADLQSTWHYDANFPVSGSEGLLVRV